jgi:hypothetical protein
LKPLLFRLAATAVALASASCIDSREEFWLEADGSGRAEIRISAPAAALAMKGGEEGVSRMIEDFMRNAPEIRDSAHQVRTEGDRAVIELRIAFDSALDLVDLAQGPSVRALPDAATHLAGEVEVDFNGRTLELERSASPGKALPGAALLPAKTLDGHRLLSIVHLPASAFDHNATRVENGGRTLVWDVPLAEAVRKPVVSRFKMKVPLPWGLMGAIGAPVSLLALWALARWRKRVRPIDACQAGDAQ